MHSVKVFISTDGTEENGYLFTDNNIKSIKFSHQLMDTSFDITPGVIEQYADIVIKDKEKSVRALVMNGTLGKDMKVFVYIDNVVYQTYYTSTWDVQAQTSTVTLHCNDPCKKLENVQIASEGIKDYVLWTLFSKAFTAAGYSWTYANVEVNNILIQTICGNTYLQYQDALTLLRKLCLVGFFRVFWNKDKFIIARCM